MCLPGFIPIWETQFSRLRMFPGTHIPEFIHSPIRAGIGRRSLSEQSVPGPQQFSGSNRKRRDPGKYFWGVYVPGKYGKRVGFSRMLLQRGNVFIFKNVRFQTKSSFYFIFHLQRGKKNKNKKNNNNSMK